MDRLVIDKFKWSFEFYNKMAKKKLEMTKKLLKFSQDFNRKYEEVTPFHLFLLDLIFAGMKETDHSRFLWKILSYKTGGTYPILESFCKELLKFELNIKEPKIEREKNNIDILIQDQYKEYALIIENKIHNAKDQSNQLARYINLVKRNMNPEKIYICYLPRDGKEPVEDSWKNPENSGESYKDEYKDRFKIVSFKNDISQWLENLKNNDTNLSLSLALEQYVYLIEKKV